MIAVRARDKRFVEIAFREKHRDECRESLDIKVHRFESIRVSYVYTVRAGAERGWPEPQQLPNGLSAHAIRKPSFARTLLRVSDPRPDNVICLCPCRVRDPVRHDFRLAEQRTHGQGQLALLEALQEQRVRAHA